MKRGRIASFTEIARIVAGAKADLIAGCRAGKNHNYAAHAWRDADILRNQAFLRRVAAESTKRLRAAGIHLEGA